MECAKRAKRDFREEFHFLKVPLGRLKSKELGNGNSEEGKWDESFILVVGKLAVSAQFISGVQER